MSVNPTTSTAENGQLSVSFDGLEGKFPALTGIKRVWNSLIGNVETVSSDDKIFYLDKKKFLSWKKDTITGLNARSQQLGFTFGGDIEHISVEKILNRKKLVEKFENINKEELKIKESELAKREEKTKEREEAIKSILEKLNKKSELQENFQYFLEKKRRKLINYENKLHDFNKVLNVKKEELKIKKLPQFEKKNELKEKLEIPLNKQVNKTNNKKYNEINPLIKDKTSENREKVEPLPNKEMTPGARLMESFGPSNGSKETGKLHEEISCQLSPSADTNEGSSNHRNVTDAFESRDVKKFLHAISLSKETETATSIGEENVKKVGEIFRDKNKMNLFSPGSKYTISFPG